MKLSRTTSNTNPPINFTPRPEVLLHSNIPKPLHGLNPRTIKGKDWWDSTRKAAYASTNFHCIACSTHNSKDHLEAHELYDISYPKGTATYLETIPLCSSCHAYIHSGLMEVRLEKGEISYKKYRAIKAHGNSILRDAKLRKPKEYKGVVAPWNVWALILDGISYPTKFKSMKHWQDTYAHPTNR